MKRKYIESNIIPAGTKVVFFANAGMVGTDHAEGFILRQDTTEGVLDDEAWCFGVDWAESYGVYPASEDGIDLDDSYSEGIEGYWDIYNAEEHKGQITYSNAEPSFTEI